MGIGFMDGKGNYAAMRANTAYGASFATGSYGTNVGTSPSGSQFGNYVVGLTSDSAKSGVVGTVTRSVLDINFAIKY